MVPGSTLMYGSSFIIVTFRPRVSRMDASEAAARPLPSEDTTPPGTKIRGGIWRGSGQPSSTGPTAQAHAAAGPATRRARAEKPAGQGPAGLEQVLNGASAALALLLFLFLALRPGLVPRVVARAGGLAALGAFVCLGAVAGFL